MPESDYHYTTCDIIGFSFGTLSGCMPALYPSAVAEHAARNNFMRWEQAMNRMKFLTAAAAVLCAASGTGLLYAAASAAVPEISAAVSAETVPAVDDVSLLFAKITRKPDATAVQADGQPDLTGLQVKISGLGADGKEHILLQDASPEELREKFDMQVVTEPNDPSGWTCRITFSAFSTLIQDNVSASVTLKLDDPQETEAPATAGTTALTTAETVTEPTTSLTVPTTVILTTVSQTVPATSAETTVTTTATAAETPAFLLGDCNGDSIRSIADAVQLCKWLICAEKSLPSAKAADIDGNGCLNAADLSLLKRMLLGQMPEFPVAEPVVIDGFTRCTAVLSDTFSDWRILVIVKHQYSVPERLWSAEDFAGVAGIKAVSQYTDAVPYRQVLQIALKEPSKENVLELIHSIEALGLEEIKEVQVTRDFMGDKN